jgi:DNA polymerase-3 subunit delta'
VRVIDVRTPVDRPGSQAGDDDSDSRRQRISIYHVHQIQREASLKPFEGRTRVFIIDGAELMSTEAANSLLKTLEEPSDDVLLVLIAPDKSALPATIVSRCQVLELRPVPVREIEQALVERHGADGEQALLLARLSRGRPGWAIAAISDPTLAEIETQSADRIGDMVEGSLEDRFRYARDLGNQWWRDRDGVLAEMGRWSEWWRDVAVAKHGMAEQVVNVDRLEQISGLAAKFDDDAIAAGIGAVESARKALLANAIPRLVLEVMALDMPVPNEAPAGARRN